MNGGADGNGAVITVGAHGRAPLRANGPVSLYVDIPRPGAENMALDSALLHAADSLGKTTLRLYRWDPPCLSFGRNEAALERYDRAAIERLGLEVVRRPTGGRAVWHEHEVTYAFAAPIAAFGSLKTAYGAIHRKLADALRSLGADVTLAANRRTNRAAASLSAGACFASPVGGEVLIGGRKVVGSAQVRQGDAFLQHGSILLDGSQDMVTRVSRKGAATSNAITLTEALGRTVAFEEVARAVANAFNIDRGETVHEKREPNGRVTRPCDPTDSGFRFSDSSWTWRR